MSALSHPPPTPKESTVAAKSDANILAQYMNIIILPINATCGVIGLLEIRNTTK